MKGEEEIVLVRGGREWKSERGEKGERGKGREEGEREIRQGVCMYTSSSSNGIVLVSMRSICRSILSSLRLLLNNSCSIYSKHFSTMHAHTYMHFI